MVGERVISVSTAGF